MKAQTRTVLPACELDSAHLPCGQPRSISNVCYRQSRGRGEGVCYVCSDPALGPDWYISSRETILKSQMETPNVALKSLQGSAKRLE